MKSFRYLENHFSDGPIEESTIFLDETSAHSPDDKACIDENPRNSIYSLKSSVKVESTTERGFVTFLKGLIGTGILALPYVINKVGLIPAWILLFVVGYLNYRTMQLVHIVASDLNLVKVDFGRLSEVVTQSKAFRYLAEINIHIMQIGSAIPGIVFIYQYFDQVSCLFGWDLFCGQKSMQILAILLIILPIGSITDLHYLSIPSAIALGFQLLFYMIFLSISFIKISQEGIAPGSFTDYDLGYLAIAFATILYAYEAIGMLLEIRASVANNSKFSKILYYSFAASTFTYLIFGTIGNLAFGKATQSVIFLNLNQADSFVVFVEFGYLFALIITFPAGLFPPMRIIENWRIFRNFIKDKETGKKSKLRRQMIRQPVILLIVLIASIVPSFEILVSLFGGMNFTILSFIVPVVLYNTHFKDDPKKRFGRICNWIIMVAGIILGGIATVESLTELSKA